MKISPSILDANFQALQADLDSIATADRIHLDIMDGHYVPNLSFGLPVLKGLDYPVEIEAHLMVNNPGAFFAHFEQIGCKTITFHIENTGRVEALRLIKDLQSRGLKAGVCVDGYTSVEFLSDELLQAADQILVMSVKAGFGGQSFMPTAVEKVTVLRARGFTGEIEVDGGVNLENVALLSEAGADIVVVGSALMKQPSADRASLIAAYQQA